MNIQFTFKHMESSPALIKLAEEKFSARVERFTARPVHMHVTFSTDGLAQRIHVTLLTAEGRNIEAEHEGSDMYAEIDEVASKLEVQLRRHKEKMKSHKGGSIRDIMRENGSTTTTMAAAESTLDQEVAIDDEDAIDAGDILNFETNSQKPLPTVCG